MRRDTSDLLHGTLDLLVLKAVATQPIHGFGLSRWIEQRTKNELEIVDSALYKATTASRTPAPSPPSGA